MIYTRTIIVRPSKVDKTNKSVKNNGTEWYFPIDLDDVLDKEVQNIYKDNGENNILSMTITPKIEYFIGKDIPIALPIPVRYDIVYVYKSDEI